MRTAIFSLIIFIFLISSVSAIKINEIKPRGAEFIEIYNPETEMVNLSLWTIKDNSTDKPDTITCPVENCSLETNAEYFLILGRNTKIENITSENTLYFYVDDQKIGDGLNDNGDAITIKENNESLDSYAYGIISNISFSFQYLDSNWCEGIPTPGKTNKCYQVKTPDNSTLYNSTPENMPPSNNQTNQAQNNQSQEITAPAKTGYDYSVVNYPSAIAENFSVKLKIENYEADTKFEIWSYVYSASKCYSLGGREANMINVTVNKGGSKIFELQNKINISEIAANKDYNLKVKILRQGLKTSKEFTFNLSAGNFSGIGIEESIDVSADNLSQSNEDSSDASMAEQESGADSIKTEQVSYIESKSLGISRLAIYIFAGIMMALSIYLLLKR
jgi:hypothetical protein